jgi:hypothetical protein
MVQVCPLAKVIVSLNEGNSVGEGVSVGDDVGSGAEGAGVGVASWPQVAPASCGIACHSANVSFEPLQPK